MEKGARFIRKPFSFHAYAEKIREAPDWRLLALENRLALLHESGEPFCGVLGLRAFF
jgi:hypothetical protein